jgi:hypothetical protein
MDLQYPSSRSATPSGLSASPITDPAHPDRRQAAAIVAISFTRFSNARTNRKPNNEKPISQLSRGWGFAL